MQPATIKVTNMLRVSQAEVTLTPGTVACVTGPNASGKTSLASVIAGALCRDSNPLGASKAQGKLYVQDDCDHGEVLVAIGGEPAIRWQAATDDLGVFQTSKPITPSTAGTTGLVDFTAAMSLPARTALWESYFLPPPEKLRDMIHRQLEPLLQPRTLAEIMELVDAGDMSAVVRAYEQRARAEKRNWTKFTGETWGKAKGADWTPEGWRSDLDGVTVTDAQERVEAAQAEVRAHNIEHAVSVAEAAKAQEAAAALPAAREEAETKKAAAEAATAEASIVGGRLAELQATVSDLRHEIASRPQPRLREPMVCPECDAKLLSTRAGQLVAYDEAAANAAMEEWRAMIADRRQQLDEAMVEVNSATATRNLLREKAEPVIEAARQAMIEMSVLEHRARAADAVVHTDELTEQVQAAEAELERQRADLALIERRQSAREAHVNVIDYTLIAQTLGPKGVRATAMETAMQTLDQVLEIIARVTGWPRVRLGRDYSISIGQRTFLRVCAESERLRAQYALQIAIARCRREPFVILDQIDHLDSAGFPALFKLLHVLCGRADPPAFLVAGTEFEPAEFNPEGPNYQLANGRLEQLTAA